MRPLTPLGGIKILARAGKKKSRVPIKEMRLKNDPMVRFYERTQDWLQTSGRPVVMAAGVLALLVLLYTAGYYFFEYRESKAAAAFAQAFEKYNTPLQDQATPNAVGRTYPDANTKWQETGEAFERLASEYSGYYGAIGNYYAGVAYLHTDRDKGIRMLQQAAQKNDQPTSDFARLALAEDAATNGETDQAISKYEELLNSNHVPKPVIQLALGRGYEKKGDTEKAVAAYFEAVNADRSSPAGMDAEKRLSALAPDRLKALPPPDTSARIP